MRTTQWKHQAAEYIANRGARSRALLWQPRTGKTKQIIDTACWLASAFEINGVIIVAPNGVHRAWVDLEIKAHQWVNVSHTAFAWRFSKPGNAGDFEQFMHRQAELKYLAFNMESIIRPEVKKALLRFIKHHSPVLLVFDEAHHFSRPGAKRTATARSFARRAHWRRILTGTSVEDSPLQAFSEFELLEKAALGYDTYAPFKAHHADYIVQETKGGQRYPRLAGYKNLDQLKERMAPYSSVVLREDCEDLPAVQTVKRIVELTPTQRSWWNKVKDQEIEFLEKMNSGQALYAGAAKVKLQQIEGGFWKTKSGIEQIIPVERNPKMLILFDEIEQYDGSMIVWFQFIHELEAAYEALNSAGITAGRFHGKAKLRDRDFRLFREGKIKPLLAQPAAMGEGYTLSNAGKIVWYSQTPSARLKRQANERATAMGKASVQVVDMYAPGGVDQDWITLTDGKTERADDVSRWGLQQLVLT